MSPLRKIILFVGLLSATIGLAPPAAAIPLPDVIAQIRDSGGRYVRAGASLGGADCSGLISVAQSLAMGQPIRRLGDTRSLLGGRWPHAIPGATEQDRFVIGVNSAHMVARIDGVGIEATTSGQPYRIGPSAASPFAPQFRQFHIDDAVLI